MAISDTNIDAKDRTRRGSASSNHSPDHQDTDNSDASLDASGTTSDSDASSLQFVRNLVIPAKYRRTVKHSPRAVAARATNYGSASTSRQSQLSPAEVHLMPLLKRSAENDELQTPRARTRTTVAARMRDTERTVHRSAAMTSTKKAFFLLLKSRIPHGYSEIGRRLPGFACAGTIFVATNIRDLFNAATDCQYRYSLSFWGLSSFALFGDLFVLGGIVYVFVMDIKKISTLGTGFVRKFNPEDYSLFLGTAAYTFEGYAMILPIADSMRKPEKFPQILTIVMALCGLITVTIGSVSYLAYGEETEAIILLNMPSGTAATLTVQLLYSIAMLLTNPLMVYPAIRTLEHWLFPRRSGKHNVGVKMQKNAFRTSFLLAVTAIAVFGLDRLDKLVAIIGGSGMPVARTTRAKVIDLALAGFGVVACVYVTYNAIKRWGIAVPPS
ncbi:hypothetical protein DL89DRAFT_269386 [Linderina pennispora]|uniref:Amino acid transporter transmembrane domain-containing protein n=1 Tax=Linderina pennispora TaxID=61395 RepID=A0A1Y1W2U3_9FUNG|nr:uncharacterized protein DL89DRAFT_269386 [Linderina pennispora]ORX67596.1 hypothetical protein DL89DRAFT_269386 [Linderina pennispora]